MIACWHTVKICFIDMNVREEWLLRWYEGTRNCTYTLEGFMTKVPSRDLTLPPYIYKGQCYETK